MEFLRYCCYTLLPEIVMTPTLKPGCFPTLRPIRTSDDAALRAICYQTVDAGQALPAPLDYPELPALLYASPYLYGPGALGFVAEDEAGVCAYALGCLDSREFYAWMNSTWLAQKRTQYALPGNLSSFQAKLLARLYESCHAKSALAAFPAHLHINLLPRAQGKGLGRSLILALLEAMKQGGAGGVHWGVNPLNTGATAFYRKLGFTVVLSEPGCDWFAVPLNKPE